MNLLGSHGLGLDNQAGFVATNHIQNSFERIVGIGSPDDFGTVVTTSAFKSEQMFFEGFHRLPLEVGRLVSGSFGIPVILLARLHRRMVTAHVEIDFATMLQVKAFGARCQIKAIRWLRGSRHPMGGI